MDTDRESLWYSCNGDGYERSDRATDAGMQAQAASVCHGRLRQSDETEVTVKSQSSHRDAAVMSQSSHSQVTVKSQSAHSQLTVNSQSTHSQLTVNSQSTHSQLM